MKNRAFRKFVASIGVAAMVMSTATNAMSPAVTRAESAQELEGQQNGSQEQGGQEDPVAQSSDDTNGAPFADAESMAVSSEDSQDSQDAAGPSESSDSNGENGTEGSSGENTNASAGSTSTDASSAGSQDATGTMSGATNGTAGTTNSTITGTTNDTAGTINGTTDTFANGTSTDASTGTTTGENSEASGDDAEASTKEITSVITEDIDLGTYFAGDAPAYAQLELPDEIEVKVDEEKQTVTVTWNGEETYHPDQAGTYIFSSELDKEWNKDENGNARYQLAEKVELPKASVRVEKKAESTEDSKAEVKSDNKTENKTDAKLDIKEDNKTDAKADNKSEGKTEEKSDNKSEVTTKPETTKETTKDTSKENTKETSKKDSASKDKTKDETEDETKGEAKNEAKEENKTDTKDETAKADQKKKVTNAASLKAVYVAEDGTILCGTVGLTGDSFTISDKAKSFNGYELKAVTLGEEELPQDTAFTRNTSTTETKEEIRTEASYTYTMDGAEHEIAAGDTATITFTYAQKEEVTPEIASIEVTGEAVDTTGAAIQGDYAFPLAVGTNDLSKTAPYIQGYEFQYAEISTDKITSIDKEVLEAGKYAYYVDGELLKENTRITYVYQEDEDYTERLTGTCGNLTVTVSAKKDAKIPEGTIVRVSPIESARMSQIMAKISETLGQDPDNVIGVLYDISLDKDGEEIQPKESVHVTMKFDGGIPWNVPEGKQIADTKVVHMHGGETDVVAETAEDGNAEFETESFSTYVLMATYAESNTPASNQESSNLRDFLNGIIINGKKQADGDKISVKKGVEYEIQLGFKEISDGKQFNDSQELYYEIAGLHDVSCSGTFVMEVEDEGEIYRISGNTYSIENGIIKVKFNKADPNFSHLQHVSNASFSVNLRGMFDENVEKIDWGSGTETTVEIDNSATPDIKKESYLDENDGKVHYTLTVTSNGVNHNVLVKDTITGEALTLDENSITSEPMNAGSESNVTNKGFSYTINSMKDGEVVRIKYSADIDFSKFNGTVTALGTKNEVTVKSDESPDEVIKENNLENRISYKSISKKAGEITSKDGKKIIPWEITYNDKRLAAMAGRKITDTIDPDSVSIMKYSGVAEIEWYGKDNVKKGNKTITLPENATSWSWNVPEDHNEPYKYVIKYHTVVDSAGLVEDQTVKNNIADDQGTSTSGNKSGIVDKDEQIAVTKKATGHTNDSISWKIELTVPISGLSSAVVEDIYPCWKGWYNGQEVSWIEKLTAENIQIDGLQENENFDINTTSDPTKAKIIFYKDKGKTQSGLNGGETARTIKISLQTTLNADWVSAGQNEPNMSVHTNVVKFTGNGITKTDEAKESVADTSISKKSEQNGSWIKDGLPFYKFEITVKNINEDLDVEDKFDKTILDYFATEEDWTKAKIYAFSDQWGNVYPNGKNISVTNTKDGIHFHMNETELPSGLNSYKIVYYLKVKDEDALRKLQKRAAEDKEKHQAKLINIASIGENTAYAEVVYTYSALDKRLESTEGLNTSNPIAKYVIEINKAGADLSDGDFLEVTDTFSNTLSIKGNTVKIMAGESDITSSCIASIDGNTLKLRVPDETSLKVTYSAEIIGDNKTNVVINNQATMAGYKAESNETKYLDGSAIGVGSVPSISIVKYGNGNLNNFLEGAEFTLVDQNGNPIKMGNQETVKAITDQSGKATFKGEQDTHGWTFVEGKTYYFKETKAPTGYTCPDPNTIYSFSIVDKGKVSIKDGMYPSGYTFYINNAPEEIEISGTKTWEDGNDQDRKRPEKITVNLFADGKKVQSQQITVADGWKYEFKDLPKYKNGTAIKYTITEDAVEGYTPTVDGYNIKNTYTPETINVSGTKTWEDGNDQDRKRPASITVKLFADGTLVQSQQITAANGWKYEFKDLPKYKDGTAIKYTITEDAVDGYTSSINGYNITNTYTPEKVQVSGSKNWNDDGNAAGTRPGSITIRLYANGSEIDHKTVTEKDGWSWNWTGLNRYDTDHKEISYTISEDAVDGYTSSISGYNVTNTVNKPQVGSVILTKVDATTGTALAGAVFDLYRANNTKVGTYTTNAGGVLRVDGLTFGDYYFVETKAPEGYALESQRAAFTINAATTVSAPASVRVTNKPVDEKIGVSAAKVWDDENNTDGVRPSSVTLRLFADGVEIGSAQASEANGWTVSFGNLPKTRNGAAISYAVKEDEVGNYYEASYETGLGSDGSYVFTVKNYRETDKHYEERTGSVRGANRNKPSNGGVAGAGRGRGTGDESDMTVYGTVSGASLLALIVWMIARRKRAGKGTK